MDIRFQIGGIQTWQADVLLCPLLENVDILRENVELDNVAPWLAVAPAMRDLSAKANRLTLVHGHPDLALSRVLFIGIGKERECTLDTIREAFAKAVCFCREREFKTLLLPAAFFTNIPGGRDRTLEEAVYAAMLSTYEAGFLKTKKNADDCQGSASLAVAIPEEECSSREAARRGENAARAVLLARRLDNMPANLLTPDDLANQACELSKKYGFSCKILDENIMLSEGMGALLAVGQGSIHPPRLIILEHCPDKNRDESPIVLVGKGICFDSGGISLKPSAKMEQMKGDMAGASAVLSAMTAIAAEQLPRRVVGILACAENMPGGAAVKPGDVVRALNGDSVEITNTDAEGRLVLCDALTYAQKNYNPQVIIDIATLTGACAVALGDQIAGLFSTDQSLADQIIAAGHVGGEYYWQLPLWEKYTKKLKSTVADICHTATREGGAITAALFLRHFVTVQRWAHLDMAGVDYCDKKTDLCPQGATGFGARTLLEVIRGGL